MNPIPETSSMSGRKAYSGEVQSLIPSAPLSPKGTGQPSWPTLPPTYAFSDLVRATLNALPERFQIDIRNGKEVADYLLRNPELLSILEEALVSARKTFPEASLILKMYVDPEIDNQHPVILIRLPQYDEGFLQRLREAKKAFLSKLAHVQGWLSLTTDFAAP